MEPSFRSEPGRRRNAVFPRGGGGAPSATQPHRAMAEDGEEKLLATVQHIVQTLGSSDTMTEDILKVFSNYDGRRRRRCLAPRPGRRP